MAKAKMLTTEEITVVLAHVESSRYPERDRVMIQLSTRAGLRACPSSNYLGPLSVFHNEGSGSSWIDVKPLGADGSSGGFG